MLYHERMQTLCLQLVEKAATSFVKVSVHLGSILWPLGMSYSMLLMVIIAFETNLNSVWREHELVILKSLFTCSVNSKCKFLKCEAYDRPETSYNTVF